MELFVVVIGGCECWWDDRDLGDLRFALCRCCSLVQGSR